MYIHLDNKEHNIDNDVKSKLHGLRYFEYGKVIRRSQCYTLSLSDCLWVLSPRCLKINHIMTRRFIVLYIYH
jgi:hypothetical protein